MEKLWYYGKKNYGSVEKTMVLYRKLWKFDSQWKKNMVLWKSNGYIVNYS